MLCFKPALCNIVQLFRSVWWIYNCLNRFPKHYGSPISHSGTRTNMKLTSIGKNYFIVLKTNTYIHWIYDQMPCLKKHVVRLWFYNLRYFKIYVGTDTFKVLPDKKNFRMNPISGFHMRGICSESFIVRGGGYSPWQLTLVTSCGRGSQTFVRNKSTFTYAITLTT